jgi:Flp pilus assembly protein TadG
MISLSKEGMQMMVVSEAVPEIIAESVVGRLRDLLDREDELGSSMIEFALTLPVLLLVVTGIMMFGAAMNNYVILNNAASIGARQLAINRGNTTDPCATAANAIILAAPTLTSSKMSFAYSFNGHAYSGTTCNGATVTSIPARYLVVGQPITVTVNYPCSLAVYGKNYAPTCNLQAQLTELVQ